MEWYVAAVGGVYGLLLVVALTNALLVPRVAGPRQAPGARLYVLIPARDEAQNLPLCLPPLVAAGAQVFVFDDESSDGTAEVAASLGATVVRAAGPPPPGWTGKNRACHELAKVASEASPASWLLFLDADTRPEPGFIEAMARLAETERAPVVTGFPRFLPGAGLEPAYLSWVPWLLLATNPFGLVRLTGAGHNGFTNGQVTLWEARAYWEIRPHERVAGRILEDVLIGRLLARERRRVGVVDLSRVLGVRMYPRLREAVDGMSKNSYEITGSVAGSVALALFLVGVAWGWLVWWPLLGLLVAGKLVTDAKVRTPLWVSPLAPLTLTAAALTVLRSIAWHKTGRVTWKGRRYG